MRIIHTSDWHLGHRLHGFDRSAEHAYFLRWLIEQLEHYEIDALLIAGDIFDTSNPPASAVTQWYDFLADVARRCPGLHVVAIGGNHDSAARLDAPSPLLQALKIEVRGGRVRRGEWVAADELVVEIRARSSKERAWVAAVPFLRPCDLPSSLAPDREDALASGVAQLYNDVLAVIEGRRDAADRVLALGHLYLSGTQPSELSERLILGGTQHALPASLFARAFDYVALGHLHRAQRVSEDRIRYSGSPLPLALDERDYAHQIVLVQWQGDTPPTITPILTPRLLALPRIPKQGAVDLPTALAHVQALPDLATTPGLPPRGPQALLEISIEVQEPTPGLRAKVEALLKDKGYQLAKIGLQATGASGAMLAEQTEIVLDRLQPHEVLQFLWQSEYGVEVPAAERLAFAELLDAVHQGDKA